jgi:hypothetical protein
VPWPPGEEEWHELLKGLPPEADRLAFRQAIESAAREYIDDADRDKQLLAVYREIKRIAGLQQLEKLCQAILRLKNFPLDPQTEATLRQVEALKRVRSDADLRAVFYLSTSRRGRFMSRLSLAWTGPGRGDLPISETGSFVEFMATITALVFSRPLDGSGVKRFARRERARRATLQILNHVLAGAGVMKVDAFVINGSSDQQKSG